VVVFILEKVPASLRGELTRWTLELKSGVFVGSVSAMVRNILWEKVCLGAKDGAATLIHSTDNEQGFAVQMFGDTSRRIVDFEGLWLVGTQQIQGQF
jgi:CRISPR-associated protein Cas2